MIKVPFQSYKFHELFYITYWNNPFIGPILFVDFTDILSISRGRLISPPHSLHNATVMLNVYSTSLIVFTMFRFCKVYSVSFLHSVQKSTLPFSIWYFLLIRLQFKIVTYRIFLFMQGNHNHITVIRLVKFYIQGHCLLVLPILSKVLHLCQIRTTAHVHILYVHFAIPQKICRR